MLFPLGFEEIGWLYGLSFDDEDYLAVYIFRTTDYGGEPAIKVSDSLEEFINGLRLSKPDEIIMRMGSTG